MLLMGSNLFQLGHQLLISVNRVQLGHQHLNQVKLGNFQSCGKAEWVGGVVGEKDTVQQAM